MSHNPLSNRAVLFLAVMCGLGSRTHPVTRLPTGVLLGSLLVPLYVLSKKLSERSSGLARIALLALSLYLLCSLLAGRALSGLHVRAGSWSGRVTLLSDPVTRAGSVSLYARVDGKHLLLRGSGPMGWKLNRFHAGDELDVDGRVQLLRPPIRSWMIGRHLAGRFELKRIRGSGRGSAMAQLANGVRATLQRSARVMPPLERGLFGGFVLGDATGQSSEVSDDFRASGLTHLLVVSGQNVAFTLAVADPLLRRLGLRRRFLVGVLLLFVFATVTRFEPSVIRAAVMAGLVAFAKMVGRPQQSIRIVGLATIICVLIDPLLMWSVGFGLSIAACVGLAIFSKPIEALLPGPSWLVRPLATTLAAQSTTALLIVPIFGGVPVIAPAANLLALPAAAPVMSWGVAAGIPAGLLGPRVSQIVHTPTKLLLRFVASVARIGAQVPIGQLGPRTCMGLSVFAFVSYRLATRRLAAAGGGADNSDNYAYVQRVRRRFLIVGVLACCIPSVEAIAGSGVVNSAPVKGAQFCGVSRRGVERIANVVIITSGVDAGKLLTALRLQNIRAINALVVASGGKPQASVVRAVRSRVAVGMVLVGDRQRISGVGNDVFEARENQRIVIGATDLNVTKVEHGKISFTCTAS
jgi:competence protein ComEC